jgi:hypothetical protein
MTTSRRFSHDDRFSAFAARAAAALGAFTLAAAVSACAPEPLRVTSTTDGESGSLRDVIGRANDAHAASLRVEVPPGNYELSRCSAEDSNAGGDLDITVGAQIALVGTGPGVVIKQTCEGERVLDHHGAGRLSVTGMTLTGGNTLEDGGAIRAGSVALANVTLNGNQARHGGALFARSLTADALRATDNTASLSGGALHVTGDATLTRSTIGGNEAESGGGAVVNAALTVSDTRVTGNSVTRWWTRPFVDERYPIATSGAGIVANTVMGDRITVDNNHLNACTIYGHRVLPLGESRGGGILAESVTLTNSTVTNNTAPECPGLTVFGVTFPPSGLAISARTVTLEHVSIADSGTRIEAETLAARRSLLAGAAGGLLCGRITAEDGSYNLIAEYDCGTSGMQELAVVLAPLADNGGLVPTRLPSLAGALVDAIPEAACPTRTDARGVPRPQAEGCDIGAVEVERPAGFGASDLSVAFVNPPPSLVVGGNASWQVAVENKGPNTQAPAVLVEDLGLRIASINATGGGTCARREPALEGTGHGSVVCSFPRLAAGARETVTITGDMATLRFPYSDIYLHARVSARGLLPPLADDEAELTTPLSVDATLHMEVMSIGEEVSVSVFNTGPYTALGSEENPIRIRFRPAPGVHVDQGEREVTGLLRVRTEPTDVRTSLFTLTFDGTPPSQLGTVELHGGLNQVSGPASIPVLYVPRPDLRVGVWREPGVIPVGALVPVTVEVENKGPGPATNAEVMLYLEPNVTWTPEIGSVEATLTGYKWHIPALAVGSRALLHGAVEARAERSSLSAQSFVPGDATYQNDSMSVEVTASPNGTSDLRLTRLELTGIGPYYVRATLTNSGAAPSQGAGLSVSVLDGRSIEANTSAALLSSTLAWDCISTRCFTFASLPPGSSHTLEFDVREYEPIPGFRVTVSETSQTSTTPDPDPRNNTGTILR